MTAETSGKSRGFGDPKHPIHAARRHVDTLAAVVEGEMVEQLLRRPELNMILGKELASALIDTGGYLVLRAVNQDVTRASIFSGSVHKSYTDVYQAVQRANAGDSVNVSWLRNEPFDSTDAEALRLLAGRMWLEMTPAQQEELAQRGLSPENMNQVVDEFP